MPQPTCLHVAQPTTEGLAAAVLDHMDMVARRGWSVALASPDDGGLLPETARERGYDVHPWPAVRSPTKKLRREVRSLRAILARTEPDLVHLQSSKAGLSGRIAIRGHIPTVFSPHAWSFLAGGAPQRAAAVRWERFGQRWTDVVVCCSESERQEGHRQGLTGRSEVVLNAVKLGRDPVARYDARARLAVGLPEEAPWAVCVGRLVPQKGQDVLLDAWPRVLAAVPDARLVLVGDGELSQSLRRRGLANIHFAGSVPRDTALDWISAADVVVAPSRYEGLSVAVLEALALGRPVVASDAQGMQEAVLAGAGVVVPREDPRALAQALEPYLADRDFAEREAIRALQGFRDNWEARYSESGDMLAAIYASIVG